VKFGVFMGLFLGLPMVLVGLLVSYIVGAVTSSMLLLSRRKSLKSQIPFGPFLVVGTLVAFFYGNQLVHWYVSLF